MLERGTLGGRQRESYKSKISLSPQKQTPIVRVTPVNLRDRDSIGRNHNSNMGRGDQNDKNLYTKPSPPQKYPFQATREVVEMNPAPIQSNNQRFQNPRSRRSDVLYLTTPINFPVERRDSDIKVSSVYFKNYNKKDLEIMDGKRLKILL